MEVPTMPVKPSIEVDSIYVLSDGSYAKIVDVSPKNVTYRIRRGSRGRFGEQEQTVSREAWKKMAA